MRANASRIRFFAVSVCLLTLVLVPFQRGLAEIDSGLSAPSTDAREATGFAPAPLHHHGIMHHIRGGVARAHRLLTRYGYPSLFLAIFLEGCGIPAPGQTILMAASVDAASGRLNVVLVLAFALAAAVLGNVTGYAIGRWGGHRLLKRLNVQQCRLERMEKRFARNGVAVLLIARFFDGLRQLNGIVAGLLEMPWREFVLWTTAGAILWTGVWGAGVYFLGKRMILFAHLAFARLEPFILVFTAAALVALIAYLFWQRRSRRC